MIIPNISIAVQATPVTPHDKSTDIIIATYLLMAVFIIMFISREGIKFMVLRKFAADDLLISLAVIFAIGYSATTLVLVADGLGTLGSLTIQRAISMMKGYYASDFLYILSLCFAKLSLVTFFHSIVFQGAQRRAIQGLGIFILAWTLASLAAVAFQCGLPRPWEMMTLHCYNRGAFWIVYCIIDMTTDVGLIMLSVNLVAYLKVALSRKVVVVACFAPRVFVIGAALARLIYLFPITPHDNPEYRLWIPIICTEVQICLSISTACIPYMKPFFEGAEAVAWRADHRRSKCMKVNNPCGYQSVSGNSRGHKQGKEFYSMDSTASASLKYGRTPDHSPRIPTPAPLSPLTPPRYSTPPNSHVSTSRSPSQRGLKLQIPPPNILIQKATDPSSPQTASSHALSPELLSPQHARLSPSRFSPNRRSSSRHDQSSSPRPLLSHSPSSSPDSITMPTTPPRAVSFSLFPRTTNKQYSQISPVTPRLTIQPPLPIPPVPAPRSRSTSQSRNVKRVSKHRMAANNAQPRSTPKSPSFPTRTSSLPRNVQPSSEKYRNVAPIQTPPTAHTSAHTSTSSPPSIPSYYFTTAPSTNPPNFPPPEPPSPQRLRNLRIIAPLNSSRKEQMSPTSPAAGTTPKTPLTFWRDESSTCSEVQPLSAGASAGFSGESGWRAERPWEREPMPIVRAVGRGSPRIVPAKLAQV